MKKRLLVSIFAIIFGFFAITGCTTTGQGGSGGSTPPEPDPIVVIQALEESISIKDTEVNNYKYGSLFKILLNDVEQPVLESYIDASEVKDAPGAYRVYCSFQGKTASLVVNVSVTGSDISLTLAKDEVTVKLAESLTYDYLSLFTATIDGITEEITPEQVTTNLESSEGTYWYTVSFKGLTKTLTIHIVADHNIEIILSYPIYYLQISEVKNFDYTTLFTLYVDSQVTKVELDMIDASAIVNPIVGNEYAIIFNYTNYGLTQSKEAIVKVIEDEEIVITTQNVVTYPNDEPIDLKSLFTIRKGEEVITVTSDMISGSIDYSKAGNNEITLTYMGNTAIANVELRLGVVINYKTSDTIIIQKGTNQDTYAFANDFEVTINGILFDNIQNTYFDLSTVDFNNAGTYDVTLTIPYNDKPLSLSGVNWTYYEKTIHYVVVENKYEIEVSNEEVIINHQDKDYNVFSNLVVTINGRRQTLVQNKDYVDVISCYAELVSAPLDFNDLGVQKVEIAVYVDGPNKDPILVSYNLTIESEIKVIANDTAIFTGTTLYTKDLFEIQNGSEEIKVTQDMISGKVDCFTPGVYYVTIYYQGIEKTAKVVVLDNNMKGVYKTNLETIPNMADYDEEYGYEPEPSQLLGDLIVDEDGNMTLSGSELQLIGGSNETSMSVIYYRYNYNLYYIEPGIVVLVPLNELKMTFSDYNRPMVYFNESVWNLEDRVVVNSASSYVLEISYTGYSIDLFKIKSKIDGSTNWFGLKTEIVQKLSSDTIYDVTYGVVEFNGSFDQFPGKYYSFNMNNDTYSMQLQTPVVGKIQANADENKYKNKTFTGIYNGVETRLVADAYGGFTLLQGSTQIFSVYSYDISKMKNGGPNYVEDILLVYSFEENIYSYKFILDVVNETFTYVERDPYFGLYETDTMYLFIDGYGNGHFNVNSSSYKEDLFTYEIVGNSLELIFKDSELPIFEGYHAKFYIDTFGNILTTNYLCYEVEKGTKFINYNITNGAIVNILSHQIGQDADAVAKSLLYDNIEIITKDGVLSKTEKEACIDVSKIRFNTPGFYQISITLHIDDKDVVGYYSIQVLEDIYANNSIVATYGSGVIFDQYSLSIDKYGQVILNCAGVSYKGTIKISGNTFIINAKDEDNNKITATGNQLTEGLIVLRCSGAITFQDYYTTGTSSLIGCENNYLRRITINNQTIYIYSTILNGLGEIATVVSLNDLDPSQVGSINEVTTSDKTIVLRINAWDDTTNGLTITDSYRGTYTNGVEEIFVNGFGSVVIANQIGEYILNDNVITVSLDDMMALYRLDNENYTFEEIKFTFDNTIFEGKIFAAEHNFVCDTYVYAANTSFAFGPNSEVLIISTSDEHDNGEYSCTNDFYNPSYASKDGIIGTYEVSNNKVTVIVNGETFVFFITNVLDASQIISVETSVGEDEHGYFANNTIFKRQ